jgi:hypothetical protein
MGQGSIPYRTRSAACMLVAVPRGTTTSAELPTIVNSVPPDPCGFAAYCASQPMKNEPGSI